MPLWFPMGWRVDQAYEDERREEFNRWYRSLSTLQKLGFFASGIRGGMIIALTVVAIVAMLAFLQ